MNVDTVLSARHLEVADQSFIIRKERALAGDQLLHEHRPLGDAGDKAPNVVEMPVIIDHVRENHGIPDRAGYRQQFLGSALRRVDGEGIRCESCKVQKGL